MPQVDLAVLAIAAKFSEETIKVLTQEKETKAFIIISAGFGEESQEGKELEQRIVKLIEDNNGCLIGPNLQVYSLLITMLFSQNLSQSLLQEELISSPDQEQQVVSLWI